ncbi:hypothetical protein HZU83_16565 [Sphaerotilus montanus]|uniref:Uncharacterized protein n=1 Tax=Sphaerotilus montanus TaxID=522889 RepID=A0A7Y9R1G7_9BURK|nr:hypothetical protein [Sphaerotilus montanus]NYG33879.1 hypothetical protein [Sphaerotilus montanus]NZD58306.1 hypothetical protein [Sphaerotilus montanus]
MKNGSLTQQTYIAPEVLGAYAALKRSAEISRQMAFLTGTDVIIVKDGRILRESGAESYDLRAERPTSNVHPLPRPVR